jgi:hypothetical protein
VTTAQLDGRMHVVLTALELISSGTTQTYNASGVGDGDSERPPGCNGAEHVFWGEQYKRARDDLERSSIIRAAEAELEQLRGRGINANRRPAETDDQRKTRILDETESIRPEEVALSRYRVSARTLRKWRREDGRNPETGMTVTERLSPMDRRRRVRELVAEGLNREQIARRLGEHPMTISRDLKKAA